MTGAQPELTIAVAATFTAEPLEEPLAYWLHELGWSARIRFAPYGQVFQPLLDPAGPFLTQENGLNVLLVKTDDWAASAGADPADSRGVAPELESRVRDLVAAVRSAADRSNVSCLVMFCPIGPETSANDQQAGRIAGLEAAALSEMGTLNGVYAVSSAELLATYPVASCFDALLDREAHIPFTSAFYAALATMIARRLFVLRDRPGKAIVLDCDGTLWRGICGEETLEEIAIDGPFRFLQEFMVGQHDAGMLLCICSKNHEADVMRVFDHHPDMVLQRHHVTSWRLNWRPKSENLRSLADELRIAADSLIFVDDNPVECAEIRAELPEVRTVQLPAEARDIPAFLRHMWAFDHLKVTPEDRARTQSYVQNAARSRLVQKALTLGEFLAGLDLQMRIEPMSPADVPRVAQLTSRTNQFNCTTIRRGESEIRRLCSAGELECLVVRVKDRFGDYGLVGVALFAVPAERVVVDTFLLSCRALGRGVEHRMLCELGRIAARRHAAYVDVRFRPTERNRPALDFLNGRKADSVQPDGEDIVFRFSAAAAAATVLDPDVPAERPGGAPSPPSRPAWAATPCAGRSELLARIATGLTDVARIVKDIESKKRSLAAAGLAPDGVPPATHTERVLYRIWTGLLGTEAISVHHNFFDLGGHSLLATQVLSRIYDTFRVELSMQDIFAAPTIAELAAVVETRQIEQAEPQQVLALLREIDGLTDDQIEALLFGEGSEP
jgi:FkbH-like protein